MRTELLAAASIRDLLASRNSHEELREGVIHCCFVGDVFLELERLKKEEHPMSEVLSRVTKFDREVGGGRLQVAALDVQALENGLFTDDPETAEIFEQAVDHRLPDRKSVV